MEDGLATGLVSPTHLERRSFVWRLDHVYTAIPQVGSHLSDSHPPLPTTTTSAFSVAVTKAGWV